MNFSQPLNYSNMDIINNIQNNSFNPSKNNCPNIFMTKLKQRINKFF